jgi:hypothetical protein
MNKIRLTWLTIIFTLFPLLVAAQPILSTKMVYKTIPYFVSGQRITLDAMLTDDKGITTTRCYFRTAKDNAYVFVPMSQEGKNQFSCVLPALKEEVTQIEYLFLVVNGDRQVIRSKAEVVNLRVSDKIPAWQTPQESIDSITIFSELKAIDANTAPKADELLNYATVETTEERYGFIVDIYSTKQIPVEANAAEGYFGGFILDSPDKQPRPVRGYGIDLKSFISPQSDILRDSAPGSVPQLKAAAKFPDIGGSDWSGFFETTDVNNYQGLSATVNQSGGSISITTSKSGLGHYLVGSINSSGYMLLYDQYDGEDWTTHFGPATSTHIAIFDYINNFTALNEINISRPPPLPPTPLAPSSISASDGVYLDKIRVSWSGVSGASSYLLYRCATTSTASCVLAASGPATTHDDFPGKKGTYYYRAKACNAGGCSPYSGYDVGSTKSISIVPWLVPLLFDD